MSTLPRGIKKGVRPLLQKSLNSLTLAIELFNRPSDLGRSDAVLMLLDHSFEMLLKASVLQRGVPIFEPGKAMTIGFQTCLDRACSNPKCLFLSLEEAQSLQAINTLRDAAQHYFLDISEEQLYFHVQSGVTLARDLLKKVFGLDLVAYLPRRVMPVSTVALSTIELLYDEKMEEIRKLLAPNKRRRQEALAALRPLIIFERAMRGEDGQPSENELNKIADQLRQSEDWRPVLPGVNLVEFVADGSGPAMALRIAKTEGIPIVIVPPETDGAPAMALKRVDELSFYSMMTKEIAAELGLSMPMFLALAMHLKLQDDLDYFKVFSMGTQRHKRYSWKALERARTEMKRLSDDEWDTIWDRYKLRHTKARRSA